MPEEAYKSSGVKRLPLVAALLNLILLGLGYLYNGQLYRAITFIALGIFMYVAAFVAMELLPLFHETMFVIFLELTYMVIGGLIAIDAFRYARRVGAIELQHYNRWYVYASVFLIVGAFSLTFDSPLATYSTRSGSMVPNLLIGDYVGVHTSAYRDQSPKHGDLVVFKKPNDEADYLKRIIGLPGDRIQIKDGILHINDEAVERNHLDNYVYEGSANYWHDVERYKETLPNGKHYLIVEESDNHPVDNTPVYDVPLGHYFVLGDNRDNSLDSRYAKHIGFIPQENLTGQVMLIYFSKDASTSWWQFWRLPKTIRYERIGIRTD